MVGRLRASSMLGLSLLLAPCAGEGQSPTDDGGGRPRVVVRGSVKDSLGAAIGNATIVAHGLSLSVSSNDSGMFSFGPIPSGPRRFEIRRIGYQPILFDVNIPSSGPHDLDIELAPLAQTLASIEVHRTAVSLGTTGFFERRGRYAGATFITPDDVEKRHPSYASQVLETVPGIQLRGNVGRKRVLLHHGSCDAAIFIDRRFMRSGRDRRGTEWGFFDDIVDAADVYAVEVYSHPPPDFIAPEFPGQKFCGAVVIWTRLFQGTR